MHLLVFLSLQQLRPLQRRFSSRAAAFGGCSSSVHGCGEAVEAAEAAEAAKTQANAYEISESLGPELCIEATASKEDS